MDDDQDERHRQLLFDTSILVPIAIAGGITFIIVVFVYCCRRYQSFVGNSRRGNYIGRSYENSSEISRVQRRNSQRGNSQHLSRNRNVSDCVQNHCMPWTRTRGNYPRSDVDPSQQQFYTAGLPQANYHSTQSTAGLQHIGFRQERSPAGDAGDATGADTPSAPPNYDAALPSYTTAMLYATVIRKNGPQGEVKSGQRVGQDHSSSEEKMNIPPPPYSQNT